ncbi:MAG: Regulatory protein PchR [Verrucomicrobia subdivision 3 bacterium]|nr:Regulatory protein PchR [Limisphaerales bacterium]MCS1413344.1 Regulatory protein PchR [Limisphaerales bacterium]
MVMSGKSASANQPQADGVGRAGVARTAHRLGAAVPGRTALFGDRSQTGFAFDWFDFEGDSREREDCHCTGDHLEVCFNLKGSGELLCEGRRAEFDAGNIWFAFCSQAAVEMLRRPRNRHQFLTLDFSIDFLSNNLPIESGNLHPVVQQAVRNRQQGSVVSEVHRLSSVIRGWVDNVRKPPVLTAALPLWYRAKALELACCLLFIAPKEELFCHRQQRLADERAAQVKRLLIENLTEPPSLKELGRRVGCSPYYLSRTFSQEVGMTIPQYLRQIRIERAAELLREGKFNVTEVALEVGYNSISHFSQAFCQTMGCCPAIYPVKER